MVWTDPNFFVIRYNIVIFSVVEIFIVEPFIVMRGELFKSVESLLEPSVFSIEDESVFSESDFVTTE